MKWALYAVATIGLIVGWIFFMRSGEDEVKQIEAEIERIETSGDIEELEQVPTMQDKIEGIRDAKSLTGVMMAFLTAGVVGVVFVVDLLPAIAHRFTHAVYDSGEMVEEDAMHDARSKLAQGDYEGAIAAFRDAAASDSMNRQPWVEIAKIQRDKLGDPQAAVATLREAIEGQEWQVNDAAYLMFRLAETYEEALQDRQSAVTIMQQVIEQFPETRHSANARHRMQEWGVS